MMSDHAFDDLCKLVADRWEELEPIRQWQLGSPEAIRASGFHIMITPYGENAAITWALDNGSTESDLQRVGVICKWQKGRREYGRWAKLSG